MTGVRVVQSHALDQQNDAKSIGSYRSTHTTRSSVLERAREYNRRIDEQKSRRSKSLERQAEQSDVSVASGTPRSQSAGRVPSSIQGNRMSTRERAMASVQRESATAGILSTNTTENQKFTSSNRHNTNNSGNNAVRRGSPLSIDASQETPRSRSSNENTSAYSSHVSRPKPTTPRMSSGSHDSNPAASPGSSTHYQDTKRNTNAQQPRQPRQSHHHHHHHQQQQPSSNVNHQSFATSSSTAAPDRRADSTNRSKTNRMAPTPRDSPARSMKSSSQQQNKEENHEAVVTPELLVDALSGHEEGLLAIAERLMEHYDSGYDVMGEAIIDAFADVQKLFQHVVEAAHMEGAAFEASRREEEITELRKQAAAAGEMVNGGGNNQANPPPQNAGGHTRHDEFIDQDVKDILTEAIRKGTEYRNNNRYSECFELYEQACQSASALLPVDSDHRGRLQLSIARAESMSHDRACAILRYAMDDVLRSGLRAGNVTLPDPSQRADVVLNRPKGHPSVSGATGLQSSEEALNSLVEEMREVMNAPVYNNTPLQSVAKRFLAALADAQKAQQKNNEKLEQSLAKLKGDFLLARAEWEEKLNSTQETAEIYKEKYNKLKKESSRNGEDRGAPTYLDHARSALASQQQRVNSTLEEDDKYGYSSIRPNASRAGSQVSLGSGLANHARSIVGSFACAGGNKRSGGVVAQELAENRDAEIREMAFRRSSSGVRDRDRRRANDKRNSGQSMSLSSSFSSETQSQSTAPHRRTPHSVASGSTRSKSSRSFREYSRSPQRVDF